MKLLKIGESFVLVNEGKIANIKNLKISINMDDIDYHGSVHSGERQTRADNRMGEKITEEEIEDAITKALPQIIHDFANGEIERGQEVGIYNKKNKLNVIAAINIKKGKDFIKIITVMKKAGFKMKPGTIRYEV